MGKSITLKRMLERQIPEYARLTFSLDEANRICETGDYLQVMEIYGDAETGTDDVFLHAKCITDFVHVVHGIENKLTKEIEMITCEPDQASAEVE